MRLFAIFNAVQPRAICSFLVALVAPYSTRHTILYLCVVYIFPIVYISRLLSFAYIVRIVCYMPIYSAFLYIAFRYLFAYPIRITNAPIDRKF